MNRAQRRAQKAKTKATSWKAGIEAVHREAAGVLTLIIVQPGSMPDLIVAALNGDRRAAGIAAAVVDAVVGISEAANTAAPKLCGSCPRELKDHHYAVVLAAPDRDDPTTAVTMAICKGCATTESGIREKAMLGFRGIWPELRPNTVHSHGGRA